MSEEKWLSATRAVTLLKLTKGRTTDRKLRLFACGCLYVSRPYILGDVPQFLDAVEAAATADELRRVRSAATQLQWARRDYGLRLRPIPPIGPSPCHLAETITDANARNAARRSLGRGWWWWKFTGEAAVARDIFGNPFRPVAFGQWRTDTAVALANGLYESRDFAAMPILADALQDAGCNNPDVLNHCRDPHTAHVRGCWVVDGVLGKE